MFKKIIATLFTKGFVALVNLAVLQISSKQLGADVQGQMFFLIINIAIIQTVNEIYTGSALVYFIPKLPFQKIYRSGLLWTIICTACISAFFLIFNIGVKQRIMHIHVAILAFIIITHSFHGVIILAKEKIRIYNFLNFFQPTLLLFCLMVNIFILDIKTVESRIISLYISFIVSLIFSSAIVFSIYKTHSIQSIIPFNLIAIIKNGLYNQLANLSHLLSNRYNVYLLANNVLVGIYSSSTSLIESVLIISSSASTIILTQIANNKNEGNQVKITFLLSKLCFILSLCCVLILLVIPVDFFTSFLGKDFSSTKQVMLYLSPGILFISFSTVISHYFSGLGKQKLIAIANISGLFTTITTSYFFIKEFQLLGACYAACLSYFVASTVLVILFMRSNKLSFKSLFYIKNDFAILKKVS